MGRPASHEPLDPQWPKAGSRPFALDGQRPPARVRPFGTLLAASPFAVGIWLLAMMAVALR